MWKPEVIKYMRENIAMYCFLQGIVCRERIKENFSSRTQNDYEKESILVIWKWNMSFFLETILILLQVTINENYMWLECVSRLSSP